MRRLRRTRVARVNRWSDAGLFLSGAAGLIVAILSLLGGLISGNALLGLILGVLSLLALAIGVERHHSFGVLEERLESISSSIGAALGGVHIRGQGDVFNRCAATVADAQSTLVGLVTPGAPRAPETWLTAVEERLARGQLDGTSVTWNVYLAGPSEGEPGKEFRAAAIQRFNRFVKAGLDKQVTVWLVPFSEKSGYDFFIVDGRSTYLTLPSAAGANLPHQAVFFADAPDVARHLVDWLATLGPRHLIGGPFVGPSPGVTDSPEAPASTFAALSHDGEVVPVA